MLVEQPLAHKCPHCGDTNRLPAAGAPSRHDVCCQACGKQSTLYISSYASGSLIVRSLAA